MKMQSLTNGWIPDLQENFQIKTYRVRFKMKDELHIHDFIGSTLRGLLGHSIKSVCCSTYSNILIEKFSDKWLDENKKNDCSKCDKEKLCIYKFLFETQN